MVTKLISDREREICLENGGDKRLLLTSDTMASESDEEPVVQPHGLAEKARKSWAWAALLSKTFVFFMPGHSSHPSLWDPPRPAPHSCSNVV